MIIHWNLTCDLKFHRGVLGAARREIEIVGQASLNAELPLWAQVRGKAAVCDHQYCPPSVAIICVEWDSESDTFKVYKRVMCYSL